MADLERVIEKYESYIDSICKHFTYRSSVEFDDLKQEVLLKLWRSLGTYSKDRPIKPWLKCIIKNKFVDLVRKEGLVEFNGIDIDLMAKPDKGNLKLQIKDILQQLPFEQASLLRLYYLESYTIEELAERYKTYPMNIHRKIKVAEKRLRKFYAK